MEKYEGRRENLWKSVLNSVEFDRTYDENGEVEKSPNVNVISFFCKRRANEAEVDITKTTPEKEWDYDKQVSVSWLEERLNHVLRYKKKWFGNKDIYQYVVLQDYLAQCKAGCYTQAIISRKEMAMLLPKKK